MGRRRINITVSESEYADLERLREDYGFRSVCSMARALLSLLVRYVVEAESRKRQTPSTGDEILDMFNEYGDWESTPFNVQPPRRRRRGNGER